MRFEYNKRDVDAFIRSTIETVAHLEALLLLWRTPSAPWNAKLIARRLWVKPSFAEEVLQDLVRKELVEVRPDPEVQYSYLSQPARDRLMRDLETAYASDLIRITKLIHAKADSRVRKLARAFGFSRRFAESAQTRKPE